MSFDEKLKKAFKQKYPEIDVIIKDDTMLFDFGNEERGEINLAGLRKLAFNVIEEDRIIKTLVETREVCQNNAKTMTDWELAKSHIFPLPKTEAFLGDGCVSGDQKGHLLHRKIAGELILTYAFDLKDRFALITEEGTKAWNKNLFDVEQAAIDNLKRLNIEWKFQTSPKTGVGMIIAEKDSGIPCTAILAQPSKIRELIDSNGYKGKPALLTVPFQDNVVVTEVSVENFIKSMTTAILAQKAIPQRPISTVPIVIDANGALTDFKSDKIPEGIAMLGMLDKKTGKTESLGNIDLRKYRGETDDSTSYIG